MEDVIFEISCIGQMNNMRKRRMVERFSEEDFERNQDTGQYRSKNHLIDLTKWRVLDVFRKKYSNSIHLTN